MNRAFDFSNSISADLLNLGASVAEKVLPWINIIKTLAEAFTSLKDYASVKDAIAVLLNDFLESMSMMRFLEDLSAQFKDKAISIEANLLAAVAAMANGMGKFGGALAGLNGTMQGGLSSFTNIADPTSIGHGFIPGLGSGGGLGLSSLSFVPGIGSGFGSGPSIVNNDNRVVIDGLTFADNEQGAALRRILEAIFGPLERLAGTT
jgi:hypothetical protein